MARTEGHKEKLLEAAKQCLYERGWARTTARDLVAASGTNLASIGYHFGSKEALLTEALFSSIEDLSEYFDQNEEAGPPPGSALEMLRMMWSGVIQSFATHRAIWAASTEALSQIDHVPDLGKRVADLYEEMRGDMADIARAADPTIDDAAARAFGAFNLAVMAGLTLQQLVDPTRAPSADDLATGLRTLVALVGESAAAPGAADPTGD